MTTQRQQVPPWSIQLTAIGVVTAAFAVMAYQTFHATYDPMLWYLNWPIGLFSVHAFATSGLSKALALAVLMVGVIAGGLRAAPLSILSSLLMSLAIASAGDSGLSRQYAAWTEMATIDCLCPESAACRLNEFNRMYDLGWARPLTPEDQSRFQAYVTLREQAHVEKLTEPYTPYRLDRHQAALHRWMRHDNIALAALFGDQKSCKKLAGDV